MDYNKLGQILKDARESNGFTQKEIAAYLNVTPQNISSWERGKSKVDIDTFETLCNKYRLSFSQTLEKLRASNNEVKSTSTFSLKEIDHIKKYRGLDDHGKELVDTILDKEYNRCSQEKAPIKLEPEKKVVPPYPVAAFGGIPEGAQDEVSRMLWEFEKKMSDPRFDSSYIDNCSHEDDEE